MGDSNGGTDLGEIDGPLLAFGGPYGNLEATRAVLDEAARRGIPAHRVICTGDVVAYGADPQATVDLIRESGIPVLMGNMEESLAEGADDCGCGFDEGSACDLLALEWFAYADRQVDAEARAWMGALPRRITFSLGGRNFAVVHGGASAINRFVFASSPKAEMAAEIDLTGCEGVVAGHTGLPFSQLVGGRLWHNAGVVGLPANDGTPRSWFGLLEATETGVVAEHLALDYDYESAAARMRARGLPEGYAAALGSGIWPSMDYLPEAERAAQGTPVDPGRLVWPAPAPAAQP